MMFMSHQDAKQKQTELQFKHIWNKYFYTDKKFPDTNQWKSSSQVIFSHNPWKALFWSKGWLQPPPPVVFAAVDGAPERGSDVGGEGGSPPAHPCGQCVRRPRQGWARWRRHQHHRQGETREYTPGPLVHSQVAQTALLTDQDCDILLFLDIFVSRVFVIYSVVLSKN